MPRARSFPSGPRREHDGVGVPPTSRPDLLSTLYAAIARRRRERYAARPDLRRRLRNPVVSIGNLAVGGRGKTPMTACVAKMLLEMGERPAVLSRGYGRRRPDAGVVIVRDPGGIRADLSRAGDEPLMLARQLPGASVLSSSDRYTAGRLAEHHLGSTVHVLDDGFQHLQLDRDVDLLIVAREDVEQPETLPSGRLREPPDTIIAADAILAEDGVVIEPAEAAPPMFRIRRSPLPPPPDDRGAIAVAGIADPSRFFDELRVAGWTVSDSVPFPDHHPYSARDVKRILARASESGAARIVTTEKDAVRLLPFRPHPVTVVAVPLHVEPQPIETFRDWLADAIRSARDLHA
jgi:tetraacyldisaccharide 4'-kinase